MSGAAAERVLVLARAPIAGRCKTRLIPACGARGAARVHRQLMRRCLRVAGVSMRPVHLLGAPDAGHAIFAELRRRHGCRMGRQPAGDLGRRMLGALNQALREGAAAAVLVGSDCAALTAAHLDAAFAALRAGHDGVLQPAEDGGYVLIGLRRAAPAHLLRGVDWSSGHELRQTRALLQRAGFKLQVMETLWDVDHPRDLRRARRLGLL